MMGMTIDECIEIWTHPTQYFPSKRDEAVYFAKDTMRKYQKIQEILKWNTEPYPYYRTDGEKLRAIIKVVEDEE